MENIEFQYFNEIVNNTRLTILEHGYLNAGKDWNFKALTSPFNRLYFVLDGNATIKNKDNNIELKAGNVYLIPLFNSYDYICNNSLTKFYVHFRLDFYQSHDLFDGCKNCDYFSISNDEIQDMIKYAQSKNINDLMRCKGLILSYISKFINPNSDKIEEKIVLSSKYSKLYGYIKDNCYADLRVNNIANQLGISASNLSKQFKNDMGFTLKSYIDMRIVQKAQEILLVTNLSVKDIAYQLKFLDEFHFSRFFKNIVGISPKAYRQRNNTYK